MYRVTSFILTLSLMAAPVSAQDDSGDISEGMSLLQEGTRLLLEGLLKEIGPALLELEGKIYDLNAYFVPEILPNGDIIIRRKVPLRPEKPSQDDEIDL